MIPDRDHPDHSCGLRFGGRYSARSTVIGSTLVARHAGRQHANIATANTTPALTISVARSVAATPKTRLANMRARSSAPPTPMAIPTSATVAPSRVTDLKIVDGGAPIASLIANSRVLRATTNDVTP